MRPATANEWMNAELNRPFSSGDALYTDLDGRAEMHTDIAALRVGPRSNFAFVALTDQAIQIQQSDGDLYLRVHHL